jgi:hypothetical protein
LITKRKKECKLLGIFLAFPSLNGSARGLYNESYKESKEFVLIEEPDALLYLISKKIICSEDAIRSRVNTLYPNSKLGDRELLYTEIGYFWIQYLIEKESAVADSIVVLSGLGDEIVDDSFLTELLTITSDLVGFRILNRKQEFQQIIQKIEEIVSVKGSGSWFEYQFPASPQYFVGRHEAISCVKEFITLVLDNKTASRTIIVNGNSGLGKSSYLLKIADSFSDNIHFIPIDCRTATSVSFLLYVLRYVIEQMHSKGVIANKDDYNIGGFEALTDILNRLTAEIKSRKIVIGILFDQFESLFGKIDILEKIRNFTLKINEIKSNIIVGFAWKTDFVTPIKEFPHKLIDDIAQTSCTIQLDKFHESETDEIFSALATELHTKIRTDLKFYLSEYSQGYPWLLKKLCAHVLKQKGKGIKPADLVSKSLNISLIHRL